MPASDSDEPAPPARAAAQRNGRARHRVQAVDLALDILQIVTDHPGLTAAAITARLPRKAALGTVRDHLATAADKQWLINRDGHYYPGEHAPLHRQPPAHDRDALILELLDHLSRAPLGATAAQLATATGVAEGLVLRSMTAAVCRGWAVCDEDGRYYLDMNTLVKAVPIDHAVAEPILQRCADSLNASVFLASFDPQDSLHVLAHSEAPGVLYIDDIVDNLAIAGHSSALGRALTATLLPRERRRYFQERGLPRFTPQTVRNVDDLDQILQQCAHHGVYTEHGETIPDIRCTAVLARNGQLYGERFALAIAQRGEPIEDDQHRVARALRECVADLAPILMAGPPLPETPTS